MGKTVGTRLSQLQARRELDFYRFIVLNPLKYSNKCHPHNFSGGQGGGTETIGGISGLLDVSGSVDDRDLAALGPSLSRPGSGRGKAGPQGKRGRLFGGDQRNPGLFRACVSPGPLSFWDGEQPSPSLQSLSVPGKRMEEGKGWPRS